MSTQEKDIVSQSTLLSGELIKITQAFILKMSVMCYHNQGAIHKQLSLNLEGRSW